MLWIAFWVLVSYVLALTFAIGGAWKEIDALWDELGSAKDALLSAQNTMSILEGTIAKKEDRWYG